MLELHSNPTRTVSRCLVCGCKEVRSDEVHDRGWVLLAECARCDHRWTARMDPTEPLVSRIPSSHPAPSVRTVRPVRPARPARPAHPARVARVGEAASAA